MNPRQMGHEEGVAAATGRRSVRIAVIIPAGPGDDVMDTLASVVQYTDLSRVILIIDDTSGLASKAAVIRNMSTDITIMPAPPRATGGYGGLWVKLAVGYSWLLDNFEPRTILRLDADALMLGPGIETAAERTFGEDPAVGLLGSYSIGPDGGARDFLPAARALRAETNLRGFLHPKRRSSLRRYVRLARNAGYIDGEHALGGAYLHSYAAAFSLYNSGWLDQPWLTTSKIGEDAIMALLTRAAGYRIADFGGPADPLALRWRGLPAHPVELLANEKLVTHSVRSWGDLTERQIRSIFAEARVSAERR
jgi:hypothetical protein